MTRFATAALVFAIGALSAPTARAQTDDARARSRAHFMAGVEHLQGDRPEEAIEELEAARSLYPTASVHFNLGLAYREVGRARDAISAFERFLAASGDDLPEARGEEVDRYLRSLRASLGVLRVQAFPEQATIFVDDEPVGRGRVRLELDPGTYQLTVRSEGHLDADREVEVAPGSDEVVRLQLEERVSAGTLALDVTPEEATVSVDGRVRGMGDLELQLSPGPHSLLLEYETARREQDFEIVAGERLSLSLSVDASDDLTWLWVTLALVAVAGGAAATVTYFALNPSDQPPLQGNLGVVMTSLEVR